MALKGDSVRLEVNFRDFDGIAVEPDSVTLTIYDNSNIAIQSISITTDNRKSIGSYYYDYVIPFAIEEYFIYEFCGLYKGRPILGRNKVHVEFV